MSNTAWNPPTGPPNGAPVRPADARREIDEALDTARTRDRELRAELFALTTARVQASSRLAASADEVAEATSLAKRALIRSNESARAGQRADAARLTGAAQVFARRLRDARAESASLEREAALAAGQAQRARTSLGENVGWLRAVAAARLPMLSGRKANRARHAVEEVVAQIGVPTDDLVARATEVARTALDAARAAGEVVAVSDEDLENELELEGTDTILDDLRAELDLPAPAATGGSGGADEPAATGASGGAEEPAATGTSGGAGEPGHDAPADAPPAEDSTQDPSPREPRAPAPGRRDRAEGNGKRKGNAKGKAPTTRSRRVPAARR